MVTVYDLDGLEGAEADYAAMEAALRALVTREATLTFDRRSVALAHCDACVEALTGALRTASSLARGSWGDVREHTYLDSAAMRASLGATRDRIYRVAGVPEVSPG